MEQENSCCFTGHRNLPKRLESQLRAMLREEILRLAENGVTRFLAGGALGFDTLAAQEVLRLREENVPLKLLLVLPCPEQAEKWPVSAQQEYEAIRKAADQVVYVSESYVKGCMFLRNRKLVEESMVCICWLTHQRGGTLYTVNYAKKQNRKIINLAERFCLNSGPSEGEQLSLL